MSRTMEPTHILEMLSTNREFLRRRSDTALSNLSMLHSSLDEVADEGVIISLALNDAIASMVFSADYAGAIRISQAVIDRFRNTKYVNLIASHEMLIGRCYTFTLDFDRAWEHLHMAEAIAFDALEIGDATRTLRADILHEVGMTTMQSGRDKDEAIRCFEKALRILGHEGHNRRRAVCIMAIGNVRYAESRFGDAQNYYMRAEALLEETDDYYNLSAALCNLGVCHMCLGAYGIAEAYLTRSLEIRKRSGTYGDIAGSYYNLAALYEHRGELERAYKTMLISRDYAQLSQVRILQIKIVKELEMMSLSLGDISAAEDHRSHLQEMERA
ncbi:MAG: MalT-like region [Bacteroidetes bacterium]|nr:MalT-like region [Bacteroidota bacterium]